MDFNWNSTDDDKGKWVVASAAGMIVRKEDFPLTSYGTTVTLKHADGTYSFYAHLGWRTSKSVNTTVVKGQLIGTIGYMINRETGARVYHLHYEQRTSLTGGARQATIGGTQIFYPDYSYKRSFFPTVVNSACP